MEKKGQMDLFDYDAMMAKIYRRRDRWRKKARKKARNKVRHERMMATGMTFGDQKKGWENLSASRKRKAKARKRKFAAARVREEAFKKLPWYEQACSSWHMGHGRDWDENRARLFESVRKASRV